jgi:hypothetical protein
MFDPKKTYTVVYSSYDIHDQTQIENKKIIVDEYYIENQLPKNGVLTLK